MYDRLIHVLLLLAAIVLLSGTVPGQEIVTVTWSPSNSYVERIDLVTSNMVFVGNSGIPGLNAMARDLSGTFLGVDSSGNLVTLDGDTGVGTVQVAVDFGGATINIPGLAVSASGLVFALNNNSPDDLYSIDPRTGLGTLVGPTGKSQLQGLTFGANGILYGWDIGAGLFTLDRATGIATDVNPAMGANEDIQCLATGPDGTLYGAHRDLFVIEPTTGEATLLIDLGNAGIRGMEFDTGPALRLELTKQGADGVIRWFARPGTMYQIQQRPVLGAPTNWANVGPVIPGIDGPISLTNSLFQSDQRFFRLIGLESP